MNICNGENEYILSIPSPPMRQLIIEVCVSSVKVYHATVKNSKTICAFFFSLQRGYMRNLGKSLPAKVTFYD